MSLHALFTRRHGYVPRLCWVMVVLIVRVTLADPPSASARTLSLSVPDTTGLHTAITAIAERALAQYTGSNSQDRLDNVFRLHLAARRYDEALRALDTLSMIMERKHREESGIGFAYQVYATVMSKGASAKTFDSLYKRELLRRLQLLSPDSYASALMFFDYTADELHERLTKALEGHSVHDSLDIESAVALCRGYVSSTLADATLESGKKVIAEYEGRTFVVNDSIVLTMKDGAEVALCSVRRRADTTAVPAVLVNSIYAGTDVSLCKQAALRGYASVVVNTRGKRLSRNDVEPFEHEASDIHEVIEWMAKQPWCNGSVGMYGGSYLGFSQWAAVKKPHPALKTIVPQVAVGAGIDFPIHNGIVMNYSLSWIHYVSDTKMTSAAVFDDPDRFTRNNRRWYTAGLRYRALDSLDGTPSMLFHRWLDHPAYDAYWQAMTPQREEFANVDIPVLTTTGYYDDDQVGALYYTKEHGKWNKNARHYVYIGPFDHYGAQTTPASVFSNYTIDSVARESITDLVFDWFDHVLKGGPLPSQLKDRVTYQVMGANEWRGAPSLDAMAKRRIALAPVFADAAAGVHGRTMPRLPVSDSTARLHGLTPSPPVVRRSFLQTVDLRDRSDTAFWRGNDVFGVFPLVIDTVLRVAPGKMVFAGEPMERECTLSGGIEVAAVLRTNKRDLDIVVDVVEQLPDGRFMVLTENLQRASLAADRTTRRLLTPDSICTVNITNTFVTCKRLQKGSRIIIMMGVNKNPMWQMNYGTGKDVSEETMMDATEPLRVEWFNDTRVTVGMDD